MRSLFNALYWNPHTSVCSCLCWKNNRDKKKSHREPPVFARKEQAGQSRTLGTWCRLWELRRQQPTLVQRWYPEGGSREYRPGSSCKFAGGPMKCSAYGLSSSLIIRGPNPALMPRINSRQAESSKGQRWLNVRQSCGKAQTCRGQR